jgi:DUF3060 family protein
MNRGSIGAWLLGTAAAGLLAPPAAADDHTVQAVNVERTIACDGRGVAIHGAGNRLTLRGRCPQVSIDGTGHVVHVERLGSASIAGLDNRLEWEQSLRGDQPDIDITGVNNRAVRAKGGSGPAPAASADGGGLVVEGDSSRVVLGPGGISVEGKSKGRRDGSVTVTTAEPAAAPRSITVEEGDLNRSYDCAGGGATVEGGENQLTLRRCPELTVSGAENRIVLVGPVRLIRLLGNDNTVEWSEGEGGKAPRIENPGSGNRVMRKQDP